MNDITFMLLYLKPHQLEQERDDDTIYNLDIESYNYYYKRQKKWKVKLNDVTYKTLPSMFDSTNEYIVLFETFMRLDLNARIKK